MTAIDTLPEDLVTDAAQAFAYAFAYAYADADAYAYAEPTAKASADEASKQKFERRRGENVRLLANGLIEALARAAAPEAQP